MKTLKEFTKLSEGINHDRYMRVHGKKAKGDGMWLFTTKHMGDPKDSEMVSVSGKLAAAAKEAMKKLGSKEVYVMESVDESASTQLNEVADATVLKRAVIDSITNLLAYAQNIHIKAQYDPDSDAYSRLEVAKLERQVKRAMKNVAAATKDIGTIGKL